MFKFSMALLSSVAALAMPVAASAAAHLVSPNGPSFVLDGPATLNAYQCWLTLGGDLYTDTTAYDRGNNLNGTNTPNTSFECNFIEITDGNFKVDSYDPITNQGQITVNNLAIFTGSGTCNTGSFTAAVTNLNASQIEVSVSASGTGCGSISAVLESDPADGIQIAS